MAIKIYTKTGDAGETSLFGGSKVPKNHLRVEAYGSIDELNSFIGLLADHMREPAAKSTLQSVQERMFSIGAHLASEPGNPALAPDIQPEDIGLLETEIDRMESALPPLKHFILPGGFAPASIAHICRTVCRRAERSIVTLHHSEPVDPQVLKYCNRLSDYFFVLARHLIHGAGGEDILWNPRNKA